MNKIITRMRGGLGNQLFILSFAYYVKEYYLPDSEIVLDTREYDTYKIRNFVITELIDDKNLRLYNKEDFSLIYEITRRAYHVLQKYIDPYKSINQYMINNGLLYSKRSAKGIENLIVDSNIYIYGYFQDATMVSKIKSSLLDYLVKNDDSFLLKPEKKYIAISVRWGDDYLKQGWPICSREYFENGIKEIVSEKYTKKDKICVVVFSDEIDKTKNINIPYETIYVENLSATKQLLLMKKCDDFVISNSSFSWWGAFLGSKESSIVIVPDVWYDKNEPTKETMLYYKNMRIRKAGWTNNYE